MHIFQLVYGSARDVWLRQGSANAQGPKPH